MDSKEIKPIGKILKQAGLISDLQIRTALQIQSQGHQVKFGEILVTQGILQQKTVDFFADRFPQFLQEEKDRSIGYYLQEAALIDGKQLEFLLQEQDQTDKPLGELAVRKGWVKSQTIKFFLHYLGTKEKQTKLLSPSHQALVKSLNLETKSSSPYTLLQAIFNWTGGHPLLTRKLCRVIADANYFVPSGMESVMVDRLVRERVIKNWEKRILGGYLKTIQEHLLNNKNCNPSNLLKLYLKIWYRGEIPTNYSKEKQELIELGLIIEQANHLMVSNRLYQLIFDENWVKQQLLTIKRNSSTKYNRSKGNIAKKRQKARAIPVKNEPLTHIAALISLGGLLVITPIIIIFNNSQYQTSQESDIFESQTRSSENFCVEEIPTEEASQQVWLMILQQEQQRLLERFPDRCQHNLDRLIVLNALKLSEDNRILEGIQHLCQISTNSESFDQAQFWLDSWYNSLDWGEQTRSYLNSIADCPSAESLSIES